MYSTLVFLNSYKRNSYIIIGGKIITKIENFKADAVSDVRKLLSNVNGKMLGKCQSYGLDRFDMGSLSYQFVLKVKVGKTF